MQKTTMNWKAYSCDPGAFAICFALIVSGALVIGALHVDLVLFADGAYFFWSSPIVVGHSGPDSFRIEL